MSISRKELRHVCIAHDEFMAKHASGPIRRAPMSETDHDGELVFKTIENATLPATQPETRAVYGHGDKPYPPLDSLLKGIAEGMSEYVHSKLVERDARPPDIALAYASGGPDLLDQFRRAPADLAGWWGHRARVSCGSMQRRVTR